MTEMTELTNKDVAQIFKGKHKNNEDGKVRYLKEPSGISRDEKYSIWNFQVNTADKRSQKLKA